MKKNLKHNEVASRGGKTTLAKYGKEYFSKLGARSAKIRLKKFGSDYYKRLSMSGVAAKKAKKELATTKILDDIKKTADSLISPKEAK